MRTQGPTQPARQRRARARPRRIQGHAYAPGRRAVRAQQQRVLGQAQQRRAAVGRLLARQPARWCTHGDSALRDSTAEQRFGAGFTAWHTSVADVLNVHSLALHDGSPVLAVRGMVGTS